jgi:transposase
VEDWDGIARQLGYDSERDLLLDFYVKREMSIKTIALKLGAGTTTINRRLSICGITKKPKGGANNLARQKMKLHRMDQRLVMFRPLKEVAEISGTHTTTVYKYRKEVKGGKLDGVLHNSTDSGTEPLFDSF